jgi:uncharacterized protein (DUF58 family)
VRAGRSLDFSDLRQYVPGDDVADVDWKASARHGDLLVKRYVADRKHTVVLVVDTGREFAAYACWRPEDGGGDLKRDVAIMAAGALGWVAARHGDYVGVVCSGTDGPTTTRPTMREVELERMLDLVASGCHEDSPPQATVELLEYATRTVRRRTIMVLVTGDIEVDAEVEARLRRLLVQHELVVVTVADVDPTVPVAAGRGVRDVVSGGGLPSFAAHSRRFVEELAAADRERAERRSMLLTRMGVAHTHLTDIDGVVPALIDLLGRMRRVR